MSQRADMWSARKAAVKAEAEAETRAFEAEIEVREQEAVAGKSDAEILQELELQDPEDMVAGDDFAAFMKAAVPEHLRRRALRKLWLSDPALANLDNLLDYGDDFAAEAKLGGVVKTAYQVGKGILRELEEIKVQPVETEKAEDMAPGFSETRVELDAVDTPLESEQDHIKDPVREGVTIAPEEMPLAPVKRRMRFEFSSEDAVNAGQGIGQL